jgi:hypothetical protein
VFESINTRQREEQGAPTERYYLVKICRTRSASYGGMKKTVGRRGEVDKYAVRIVPAHAISENIKRTQE